MHYSTSEIVVKVVTKEARSTYIKSKNPEVKLGKVSNLRQMSFKLSSE